MHHGTPGHFNNEIDFAGSEFLASMNIHNIKPRQIFSSAPLATGQVDCHLLPEQLGEQMATCTSLHSVRSPLSLPRKMQITLTVTISVLIKGCSAFVFILAGLADFSRLASVHEWLQVAAIETDVS